MVTKVGQSYTASPITFHNIESTASLLAPHRSLWRIYVRGRLLRQQTKNGHACGRSHVHAPVCNHRRDEFVVGEVVACIAGLIGVVEFLTYVRGIVSVQHSTIAVFHRPDNSVRASVGGNARRRSRVGKVGWALRSG